MADPITWGLINLVKKGIKGVQTTLDGLLGDIKDEFGNFLNDAEEVIDKLGTGVPPRDMISFSSESTDEGIKLTFTPPAATYFAEHTSGDGKQFACMPAGVLIRYSDTGYPRTPDEGIFGYDYKTDGDWDTESHECTIVGLTKDTKYYFTAFPYSTEHVYNKNQIEANRTEMTWVGNKGTISVTVNTPEGYHGTIGEYTITLVDQAADSPQNIEKTVTGAGVTQFGGLLNGKSYKVRLSSIGDLQAPPDSEAIEVVAGVNKDVTMTYAFLYGTISVNVSTQPTKMPIGSYTVTLTPQSGGEAIKKSGNGTQKINFENLVNGETYTVKLSSINHYSINTGDTVTAVGGSTTSHNAKYSFNGSFSSCSWDEIHAIADTGNLDKCFSLGDTKNVYCKTVSVSNGSVSYNSLRNVMFVISRINGYYMFILSKGIFISGTTTSSGIFPVLKQIDTDKDEVFPELVGHFGSSNFGIFTTSKTFDQLESSSEKPDTTFVDSGTIRVLSYCDIFGHGFPSLSDYEAAKPYLTNDERRKELCGGVAYCSGAMDYYKTSSARYCYVDNNGVPHHGTSATRYSNSNSFPIALTVPR